MESGNVSGRVKRYVKVGGALSTLGGLALLRHWN